MAIIKIATFNLENVFTRPSAMNQEHDAEGKKAIEDHAIANSIINKSEYTDSDKKTLLQLTEKYKWHIASPPKNALVQLLKIRGQLFKTTKGVLTVAAHGRDSWIGWFELLKEDIKWQATYNTGRVIKEVNPDILLVVEVENRPTLDRFNIQVLKGQFGFSYKHFMVIDGNDSRGIDLGIMSRFPIMEIRSHVDDSINDNLIFSRDCPEYDITLPNRRKLVIIPNHFKSKRNGNDADSAAKRLLQAETAHDIAVSALKRCKHVLIGGDLNDTPDSQPLEVLRKNEFEDVMSHPDYPKDRPGTFNTGLPRNKIDYLLMSTSLQNKIITTGIERRGSYHPSTWKPFDTVKSQADEASDHHLVWATFNI